MLNTCPCDACYVAYVRPFSHFIPLTPMTCGGRFDRQRASFHSACQHQQAMDARMHVASTLGPSQLLLE